MEWIKRHINWTYGIALMVSVALLVVCSVIAIPSSNPTPVWVSLMIYYTVTIIGGQVVLSRKRRDAPRITMLIPPLFAIIVLALKSNGDGLTGGANV